MNRRALLGAVGGAGAASVAVAGCLDGPASESDDTAAGSNGDAEPDDDTEPTDERRNGEKPDDDTDGAYEECNAPYVRDDELPDDLAAEVDAAFDEGEYVTDDLLYGQAVGDGTPLWRNDEPYEHRIEVDGEKRRLSFDRITAYDSPLDLELGNETDEPVSVSATITDEDGEVVLDVADRTVEADDRERLETVSEFGTYEVKVELGDGRSATSTWEVFPPRSEGLDGVIVSISDDGVAIEPLVWAYEFVPCSMVWDGQ